MAMIPGHQLLEFNEANRDSSFYDGLRELENGLDEHDVNILTRQAFFVFQDAAHEDAALYVINYETREIIENALRELADGITASFDHLFGIPLRNTRRMSDHARMFILTCFLQLAWRMATSAIDPANKKSLKLPLPSELYEQSIRHMEFLSFDNLVNHEQFLRCLHSGLERDPAYMRFDNTTRTNFSNGILRAFTTTVYAGHAIRGRIENIHNTIRTIWDFAGPMVSLTVQAFASRVFRLFWLSQRTAMLNFDQLQRRRRGELGVDLQHSTSSSEGVVDDEGPADARRDQGGADDAHVVPGVQRERRVPVGGARQLPRVVGNAEQRGRGGRAGLRPNGAADGGAGMIMEEQANREQEVQQDDDDDL